MCSTSRARGRLAAIRPGLPAAAVAALLAVAAPISADARVPLARMAVLAERESPDRDAVLALFRGYAGLGMVREAAELVEVQVRRGLLGPDDAVPLFEELADASPEAGPLIRVCDSAARTVSASSRCLYVCAMGLRREGRVREARDLLARIGPGDALHAHALHALGQMAAEEGDEAAALAIFREARRRAAPEPGLPGIGRRAALSEAETLLFLGRLPEAASAFAAVPEGGNDPVVRAGLRAASASRDASAPLPAAAPSSGRARILASLSEGEASERDGRLDEAAAAFAASAQEAAGLHAAVEPPVGEAADAPAAVASLGRQMENLDAARRSVEACRREGDMSGGADAATDLLVGLLVLDVSAREAGRSGGVGGPPAGAMLRGDEGVELLRIVESLALGGDDAASLAGRMEKKLGVYENLAHPIDRFRRLPDLGRRRSEIRSQSLRVAQRRDGVRLTLDGPVPVSAALAAAGAYLHELRTLATLRSEAVAYARSRFPVFRERKGPGPDGDGAADAVEKAVAFADALAPRVRAVLGEAEREARSAAWRERRGELRDLHEAAARRHAAVLVARARAAQVTGGGAAPTPFLDDVERAASYLSSPLVGPGGKREIAVRAGAVLAGAAGGTAPFPGPRAAGREAALIAAILPVLAGTPPADALRENALSLVALLAWRCGDPRAAGAARDLLAEFPASPRAGALALRLGHEELRAGREDGAGALYRLAAARGGREEAAVARYMLAREAQRRAGAEAALKELAVTLGELAVPPGADGAGCAEPGPFLDEVLGLALRCWMELPLGTLEEYPPVRQGRCLGRTLLVRLADAETRRGEMERAARAYEAAARAYKGDDAALAHDIEAVDRLARAGREEEALAAARRIRESLPGTPTAGGGTAERARALARLSATLRGIAERQFDEGVRTGETARYAAAARAAEERSALAGNGATPEEDELRLKWAAAAVRSGDAEGGIRILDGILAGSGGRVAERAALLRAGTVLAAYERGGGDGGVVEASILHLLRRYPSPGAGALAVRAATALEAREEPARSARIAEAADGAVGPPGRNALRLLRGRSLVLLGDYGGARRAADAVLSAADSDASGATRATAKDLYLLASLRESERRSRAGDVPGAASLLEEVARRFPGNPGAPGFLLEAARRFREGGDREGAVRAGTLYLSRHGEDGSAGEVVDLVGACLEERGETARAAALFARAAERAPGGKDSPRFLIRAARLAEASGDGRSAARWYDAYRGRYRSPLWVTAFAALSSGLIARDEGRTAPALKAMEEGLRIVETGVEPDAAPDLAERAGRAGLALGHHRAGRFREARLAAPLDRSLERKMRWFREALDAYGLAERHGPGPLSAEASRLSGDLFVEFGRALLASERPAGMAAVDRDAYEHALGERARALFGMAVERYEGAIGRLGETVPGIEAAALRRRLADARGLAAGPGGTP